MELPTLDSLRSVVLPVWLKPVLYLSAVMLIWFHGYVTGLQHAYKAEAIEVPKIIYKQGQVTTKVITKYIKIKEKQQVVNKEIKDEGDAYAIKFTNDSYHFNNEFVRLFDASVEGSVPPLSSGEPGDSTTVTVPEVLKASINNNAVAHYWETRAEACEEWAATQEKESLK